MRELMLLPCMFVAVAASAAEKQAVDHGPPPSRQELASLMANDPRIHEAVESRPLFFRLSGNSAKQVRFDVTVGGRLYLSETVRLTGGLAGGLNAVEFLARDAAQLERLYRLAQNPAIPIRVAVQVDRGRAREFSFADFVENNRALKLTQLRPAITTSELQAPASDGTTSAAMASTATLETASACQDQCYSDYLSCRSAMCDGGCIRPPCPYSVDPSLLVIPDCSVCDDQYSSCLASCPSDCTDPKSVSQYTTNELVAVYYGAMNCYRDWWSSDPYWGSWYQTLYLVFKVTVYQRTEYCDGHVSVVPISVYYTSGSCDHPLYWSCTYPWGYAWNVCY